MLVVLGLLRAFVAKRFRASAWQRLRADLTFFLAQAFNARANRFFWLCEEVLRFDSARSVTSDTGLGGPVNEALAGEVSWGGEGAP